MMNKKTTILSVLLLLIILLIISLPNLLASQKHTFSIGKTTFQLDGKEYIIRSGEMHFDRIPKEYWRHRIQMAKAMGLNTICTYLFWNKIEPKPDQVNEQNLKDMTEFCKIAQEEGLWVIVRPGPYVCAEWDMGGLPWWLLKKEDIKLRSQDPYFLERAHKYLLTIGKTLAPLQITNNGPIIMIQVENEYGHYGTDTDYLGKIKEYIIEAGFNVPLFQCDYYSRFVDRRQDLFCMVNFGTSEDPKVCFDSLRAVMPEGPVMVAEYYPGWLDHWGEKHGTVPTEAVKKSLMYFLNNKASFNFYMLHGGTSFGMWAGANHSIEEDGRYQSQTSSYDYDAPISEAGWDTPKYLELRATIEKYLPAGENLPPVPGRPETMEIKEFEMTEYASVINNLPSPIKDTYPRNMEAYDQGYGYITYSTTLKAGAADSLIFDQISDFAVIMLNDKVITTLDRHKKEFTCALPERKSPARLQIMVEAMGRVNSDLYLPDRKGIVGKVHLKSSNQAAKRLKDWDVYPITLNNDQAPSHLKYGKMKTDNQPAYYKGSFNATEQKDVFLNVSNWGKGIVWVNGHCLGRFWNIGPTQTMYLPAPWIRKGRNEVVVLDFISPEKRTLKGQRTPILDSLSAHN